MILSERVDDGRRLHLFGAILPVDVYVDIGTPAVSPEEEEVDEDEEDDYRHDAEYDSAGVVPCISVVDSHDYLRLVQKVAAARDATAVRATRITTPEYGRISATDGAKWNVLGK